MTSRPLVDWYADKAVQIGPAYRLDARLGQVYLEGPRLPDVTDSTVSIDGTMTVDVDQVTSLNDEKSEATVDDALQAAIATYLAHHMHEIAEWATVDGELVFDAHHDGLTEWNVIADAAAKAAAHMVANHPRLAPKDT